MPFFGNLSKNTILGDGGVAKKHLKINFFNKIFQFFKVIKYHPKHKKVCKNCEFQYKKRFFSCHASLALFRLASLACLLWSPVYFRGLLLQGGVVLPTKAQIWADHKTNWTVNSLINLRKKTLNNIISSCPLNQGHFYLQILPIFTAKNQK